MVKEVVLYIEGGGDTNEQKTLLRKAITLLLHRAGFKGRMPRIKPSGGRDKAFQDFLTHFEEKNQDAIGVLLVDAEDPLTFTDTSLDAPIWQHLKTRDKWDKPQAAQNNQIALMVTSMETWIIADHAALKAFFGSKLKEKALPPLQNLESRNRKEVLASLEKATEDCGKDRAYRKGNKSFQVLATLNPTTLQQHLPHFKRFLEVMRHHLP